MKHSICYVFGGRVSQNPNRLAQSRPSLVAIAVLVCSFAGAPHLWAQSFGLQTEYRLVAGRNDVRVYPSLVNSGTPLVNHDTTSNEEGGAVAGASIQVSAYYGDMSVTGSGFASNSLTNGTGVTIDQPIGGDPFAKYQDVLNVTSSTLANGTPVTINFTESFVTSLVFTGTGLGLRDFQDILNITDKSSLDETHLTLDGTSSDNFVFHTAVGDSLYLEGELHGNADLFAGDTNIDPYTGLPKPEGGSFSFYASGPLYINSVTDGADILSDSGATYSAPASSVPDSGETILFFGISLLAMTSFRRRNAQD